MFLNSFTEFAVLLSTTEQEYLNWKNTEEENQKEQPQMLDKTEYIQHGNHSNHNDHDHHAGHNDHDDTGHDDHDQEARKHYDMSARHQDNGGHNDHENWTEHDNHFDDPHSDFANHNDGLAHWDKYNQNHDNAHDNDPHDNHDDHDDTGSNSNFGFNHDNFIPYKPGISIDNDAQLRGIIDMFLFSYDKNNDGYGTQDSISKTVKYYMKIRKIRNLDGSNSASEWHTLVNGTTSEQITFNTIDPLGQGNTDPKKTEGIYEIECYSYNDTISKNGVTKNYVSPTKNVIFTIRQNNEPVITIENDNEFINFSFGQDGAVNSNNIFTSYIDGLYKDAASNQKEGIFIKFKLHDEDTTNYHKGTVYLKKDDVLLTNEYSITFTGSSTDKVGVAFIPKEDYMNDGALTNVDVVVDVKDYMDASFTTEAGGHIVQNKVSSTGASMVINVDNNYPGIVITSPSDKWVQNQIVHINVSDSNGLGIRSKEYQVVSKGQVCQDTSWVSATNDSFDIYLSNEGEYNIFVKTTDKAGNMTIKKSEIFKIAPITVNITTNPQYPNFIPASEDLYVQVDTSCFVDVSSVKVWLQGKEGNVITLATTDTGTNKKWKGYLPIPESFIDSDYNIFVETQRYDNGLTTKDSKLIKVFTPIMLSMKNAPVFEPGKAFVVEAKTTKYPTETEVKLFIGTPYETKWLSMSSNNVGQHKEWLYTYNIPEDIAKQNYSLTIRSTLPNGKSEVKSSAVIYSEIEGTVNHTDEWEQKRKDYNISKTGSPDDPRKYDTFFSGEKFIIDLIVEMADDTVSPISVGVKIVDTSYSTTLSSSDSINWKGKLWDESMIGKWGQDSVEPITFRFTVTYDLLDEQGNNIVRTEDVTVKIDDLDKYWKLHRKF